MNEASALRDVDRGKRAERLLSDPMLTEAFDLVENHILSMFKSAPLRDEEGILRAKDLLHALSLVRRVFDDAVRNGKIAADALNPEKRGAPFLGDLSRWTKPSRP